MTEWFLGGVAGFRLCRYTGRPGRIVLPQLSNPWGYGLYFTDNRVIGVSYRKIVSQAYRPAFLIFLIWIVSLVSLVAYAVLTAAKEILPLPFVMGLAVIALIYLVYLSPKHARERTASQKVSSMSELEHLTKDTVLQRSEISSVNLRKASFYDPWGGGIVTGALITVILKTGQNVVFISRPQEII